MKISCGELSLLWTEQSDFFEYLSKAKLKAMKNVRETGLNKAKF